MSSSQKLKHITSIRNQIMQKINDNQDIKRLLQYTSSSPLEDFGTNANGEVIEQLNIKKDFIKETPRIHSHFQNTILNELQTHIFVRRWKGNLSDKVIGNNIITIDIFSPIDYLDLTNNEYDRDCLIAIKISELIDDETIQSLGKIKTIDYKEDNSFENKGFSVFTLFVEVPTSNGKTE